MYQLNLTENDKIDQCQVGTGFIHSGDKKQFVLEKVLEETFPQFDLKQLSMAKVNVSGQAPYLSPVLFLYDKQKDKEIVCVVREEAHGFSFYDFYNIPKR